MVVYMEGLGKEGETMARGMTEMGWEEVRIMECMGGMEGGMGMEEVVVGAAVDGVKVEVEGALVQAEVEGIRAVEEVKVVVNWRTLKG